MGKGWVLCLKMGARLVRALRLLHSLGSVGGFDSPGLDSASGCAMSDAGVSCFERRANLPVWRKGKGAMALFGLPSDFMGGGVSGWHAREGSP